MLMLKLRPGFLVSLSTRVEGGVVYSRQDLDQHAEGAADVARWETERRILDKAEFEAAGATRGKIRSLIRSVCSWTPFGLICAEEDEPKLDEKIAASQAIADQFNGGAQHSKVKFATLRGKIAETKQEAVTAVRDEIAALVRDLEAATRLGRVDTIRDVAARATQMGRLLEVKSDARGKLDKAVSYARRIARDVVKRVEKGGEQIADVLAGEKFSAIAAARFTFDEEIETQGGEDTGESLPAVNAGRFADLGEDEDPEPEPEPELDPAGGAQ